MSGCYTSAYRIPAATLGPENPLPDIKNISYIHATIQATKAVPKRLTTYVDKGMVNTMLPYTQQDYYDRNRVDRIAMIFFIWVPPKIFRFVNRRKSSPYLVLSKLYIIDKVNPVFVE